MKHFLDYIISAIILIITAPLLLIVAIAIKLDSPGTVLYLQTRVGQYGKEFKILKFRTMRASSGMPLTNGASDPRITRVGRIIRTLHIDELAQLINVLKGDMSLIGPRPEVPEFIKFYPDLWQVVLTVKPGITGLAALKYADFEYTQLASSKNPNKTYITKILPKKLRYDSFYVCKLSLGFDIIIVLWTIKRVLLRMVNQVIPNLINKLR
ncbi:MAG: sugar transferase [Candidatus Midichloriaceae bacterium]|jgi:lipopolysaccharide/colanic/teichoic acid biosynthesis glycosyltransferase|nr:sugar transferase [Candidatus Midichloriaceae bacterium]